jgi:hypothetical protein
MLDASLRIQNCLVKRTSSPDDLVVCKDIVKQCEYGYPLSGFIVDDFAYCTAKDENLVYTSAIE